MLQFVQKARGYISGHVTKKPVMNNGASGKSFCTVSLAVNLPPYAGKDGTKIVPEPMFYELTAFGSTAEHICRDVEKDIVSNASSISARRSHARWKRMAW